MLRDFRRRPTASGFTLLELAIVVGITGLLFGGLWRLLSTGSSQLREQSAADQISQIVGATRNFLASTEGQNFIRIQGPGSTTQLTLPNSAATAAGTAACAGSLLAGTGTYCNFLPNGFFNGAGGNLNAYGQSYAVYVRKDNNLINIPAQNYDFLVITTGGDVIPDSSGGRIAANIGANGGFVFSNNTCGTPANFACGAFGSFTLDITAAGPFSNLGAFAIPATPGHIVTQNSSTLSLNANSQWLARQFISGDGATAGTNEFNSMQTPMYMRAGVAPLNMLGNQLNMGDGAAATGGGNINLQGGTIGGAAGAPGPGIINLINNNGSTPLTVSTQAAPGGTATDPTTANINGASCDYLSPSGPCQPALSIEGNLNVTRDILIVGNGKVAGQFEAATFLYTSDSRYKKDLVPLTGALDKISQLQGYHFSWKKNDRPDIGVVAQEVQKVYPELVHAGADGKLAVQYGNLVAPLIEAVKELRLQNIELQKRLDAQEKKLREMQE